MTGALRDPRVRGGLAALIAAAAVLVVTQLILPGGTAGTGTPTAILFAGAVLGLLNGLLAVGLVLVYRSHRVVNFSQAALGSAGAVMTYNLAALANWPFLLAFVAGLAVSSGLAVAVELAFVRRFFFAPRLVLTVITGGLVFVLAAAAGFVLVLPIFGNIQDRPPEAFGGSADVGLPFRAFDFRVGRLPLEFGFAHLFAIGAAAAALVGLAAFFRYSRVGIAVRAAAENADRARTLGIGIGMLSSIVWGVAGLLAGLSVILQGAVQRQFTFFRDPVLALLIPLAAAVIARMTSIPTAVAASVALSVLDQAVRYSYERQTGLREIGLFAVILFGLLLQRESRQRAEEGETSSWQAVQEQRPIPPQMLQVTAIAMWRRAIVAAAILALLLVPWVASARQTQLTGYYAIVGIALLSLTILTGWAGQVSWGQFAIVGVGAVVGGAMTSRWGIPFWFALVLAPMVTALVAMIVGLPALRIRGLFLGITTLAFAYAVQAGLFNERYFSWLLPGRIDRPSLFLLDFEDERSMYYLVVAALLLTTLGVVTMRRSRVGRILIALRENEANAQAFGVNVLRTKLAAFGLSGFVAGFAGVVLAHHQRAANDQLFPAARSLEVFVFAVVGGVGSVLGVILGAAYFALAELVGNPIARLVIGPVGLLFLLYAVPGGLASIVSGMRDGVLRIVAQRRQMIVPSLFADVDPESLERQLIPLAEPIPSAGLGSLPLDLRYRQESSMYAGRGRLATVVRRRGAGDLEAFGAAVERFGDTADGEAEE